MKTAPRRLPATLILAPLMLLALVASAAAEAGWTGDWRTFWPGGGALMSLTEQEDGAVAGVYEPGGGTLRGTVEDGILRGAWSQEASGGTFVFALSPDGRSFTGRYGTGGYWNGERIEAAADGPGRALRTTPRAALRSLVLAANAAILGGDVEALRDVDRLLVYEDGVADERDRTRRRALLWRLIELSTFRIDDAPERVEGTEARFPIGPAGTSARYPLRFVPDATGWRVVVEPAPKLSATLALFLEEIGHPSVESARIAWRNSPRGVMRRFIEGTHDWRSGGREQALATLDLSFLPSHLHGEEGPILADYLKQIIDRAGYVIWQEVPNDPAQPTPYVHFRHAAGDVVIERKTGEGEAPDRWLFSAETLAEAPELFAAMQALPPSEEVAPRPPLTRFFMLRETIREHAPRLLERPLLLETWQWLALALWTAGSLLVARLVRAATRGLVRRLRLGPDAEADRARAAGLARPLGLLVGAVLLARGITLFGAVGWGFESLYRILAVSAVAAGAWFAWRLADEIGGHFARRAAETPGYADEIVASLATGVAKLAVVVAALIAAADIADLPYEGVLTGLGVGGVALAFAARETVSNMLAGALLMTDRPFRRGHLLETHGELAVVETVGLRSTRLKRLDDTVMIIPNSQLSDQPLVNWGLRRRRRVDLPISITYDTPRERIDAFVEALRETVLAQPHASARDCHVGVVAFGPSSIDVECRLFFDVRDYDAFVAARHRLFGDVIELAKRMQVEFAFPTRTIHVHAAEAAKAEPEGGRDAPVAAPAGLDAAG